MDVLSLPFPACVYVTRAQAGEPAHARSLMYPTPQRQRAANRHVRASMQGSHAARL